MACDPLPRPVAVRRGPVGLAAAAIDATRAALARRAAAADPTPSDEADGWPLDGASDAPSSACERVPRAGTRARTISLNRLSRRELQRGAEIWPPSINAAFPRPETYGQCAAEGLGAAGNPCPHVSCEYHLYLDVNEATGSIKLNFPDREVWELSATCALEVADRDGITLEEVGAFMNLTRERARQLETRGLAQLEAALPPEAWADLRAALAPEPRSRVAQLGERVRPHLAAVYHAPRGSDWPRTLRAQLARVRAEMARDGGSEGGAK